MNVGVVIGYLAGRTHSIREVAESSASLPLGIALVLITAVARNYDQTFVTDTPLWLFGPLLFSLFSGTWLFFIVYGRCIRRHIGDDHGPPTSQQWRSFMGLFWMTAPIAWLYAMPVEGLFDPMGAARANVTLLAVVSLWRVLLMSRVVRVVNDVPFPRALGWVLVAASLEVIFVVFVGGIFSDSFSRRVLASMSGMRNAPDESLLLSALAFAWNGAWVVLAATLVVLAVFRFRGTAVAYPRVVADRVPWRALGVAAAAWVLIAWPAQKDQRRYSEHARLVSQGRYVDALAYLSRYERKDFPASRRLEPNPYEQRVWKELPPTIALLDATTPKWVRETYLSYLTDTLQHELSGYRSMADVAAMYAAIERLPEGGEWARANESAIAAQGIGIRDIDDDYGDDPDEAPSDSKYDYDALTKILASLRAMGMAETNVAKLAGK